MSRVANNPITLPKDVEIKIANQSVSVKGSKGSLDFNIPASVEVLQQSDEGQDYIRINLRDTLKNTKALAGTTRSVINNMVVGVSQGFEKKLELQGVGYRAQAKGNTLNLTLGYSHPVEYSLPDGITVETPSQTEIVVKGIDKQLVGHVASEIRAKRPPESYKGKGVRYAGERVRRKEAKKK